MLQNSYAIALKITAVYARRFPGVDVERFAIDVALEYADYEEREGASLHTCMSRALFFKLCNEVKRIARERRLEEQNYVEREQGQHEPLQFLKLSKMAELLLKHLQLADSPSQWECYQELHKRGWTYEVFKKYIAELRRKYVPKA